MSWLRRVTAFALTAVLVGTLTGCSGKSLKYEDLKRIQPKMSQDQVEEILGRGSESSDEEIAKANQHAAGPQPVGQITYRTWKDSKTMLVLGFQNGRVSRSFFTTTDPQLSEEMKKDREAQRAERPAPPDRAGRGGAPADDEGRPPPLDDARAHSRMQMLGGLLVVYATTHQDKLPANLKELEKWGNWETALPDVREAVGTGEIVIAWGRKIDKFDRQTVIAWEKDAPDQGGYAARSNGSAAKLSAAEIQANWPKK